MCVDRNDKRYRKLVTWLGNEHNVLQEALGRKPTIAEHRAHVHAFIDMVFDEEKKRCGPSVSATALAVGIESTGINARESTE